VASSAPSWDRLPAGSTVIGGSAWVRAWLEAYGSDYDVAVAVLGETEAPDAVLPLVRRRRRPWLLQMLGVDELGEPMDARAVRPADLRPLVEVLAGLRTPVLLRRLPADSPLLPLLGEVYGRRAVVVRRPSAGTPTLSLDESWRKPETHFNSRRRADIRTAQRRAATLGEVQLRVEAPAPEDVDRLFDQLVAVEAAGWKTRAGTALVSQPRMRAFYRRFCCLAAEQGTLRLGFLCIDGRPVAVQLAVVDAGRYLLFKIGYDEEFARCSPGILLMLLTVQWAAERGLSSYEFLGAQEPWTDLWTQTLRPCVDVAIFPLSPWTPVAAATVAGRLASRALRGRAGLPGTSRSAP
jgi:CelD/BcsL family acetyltransferase involved in cellulose biosynthesis